MRIIICRRYILATSVPHLCKVGDMSPSSYGGAAHGNAHLRTVFSVRILCTGDGVKVTSVMAKVKVKDFTSKAKDLPVKPSM